MDEGKNDTRLLSIAPVTMHNLLLLLSCIHTATSFAPGYWPKFSGTRTVTLLDGEWSYGFLNGWNSGFDSMSPSFNPSTDPRALTPNKTAVPSSMDVVAGGAAGYLGPRGVGMFRTTFDADTPVRLQFQACSFYCRVWVNGKEIGDHIAGGYVAFWLDVSHEALAASDGKSNELFVLADNRFNSTTAPMHTGGDFWHYGGIVRSVELHTMGSNSPVLWRAYVTPSGADASQQTTSQDSSNVDITLILSDNTLDNSTVDFSLSFDEGAVPVPNTNNVLVSPGGIVLLQNVQVPNAKLWSPSSPHLHTLTASYAGGVVIERFGLRTFGVDNGRATINGQVIKLVGWNHHTQFPVTAASPTDEQLDFDVALLKRGNANYVRGAHYPHDPRMLDRLDEAGIVFWSETLGPDVKLKNMEDWKYFMPVQLVQLQEVRSCE
jgi:beta-glucuronidase